MKRSSFGRGLGAVAVLTLGCSGSASAQEQIDQPLSDEFGVERKTGRASFPLPTVISVGGEGGGQIAHSFKHLDGGGLGMSIWPSLITTEIIPPYGASGPQWERYLMFTVTYGSISENFRILYNNGYSGTPVPEYPTGSTLVNGVFTDKHGMRITFGISPRVEYPDGRTLYFDNPTWSVWNNFGYALKGWNNQTNGGAGYRFGTVTFQAVNRSVDSCDMSANALCGNVPQTRQASYNSVQNTSGPTPFPEKYELTDAAGGKTTIRNVLFSGHRWRAIPGYFGCSSPPVDSRPYPAGLTYPGSSTETHTIQYGAPVTIACGSYTLDDIRITNVTLNGVSAAYQPTRYAPGENYGSYGGVSWIYIRSLINGQEVSYSTSFKKGEFWGQSRRALTDYKDALGRQSHFAFDNQWRIRSVTLPEGNGSSLSFDARENITATSYTPKPNSGLAARSETYTYAPSCSATTQAWCNRPLTVTDANGNTTEYTYNDRGQVLTEMRPAPAAGQPRPTVTNTYTLRTAYVKDAGGNVVAAGPPISLLTRSSMCLTQSNCTGTADEVITDYDYGPTTGLNNLNLRGVAITAANALGQMETQRTCYSYNYFGEKISETQPMAGLAGCS